MKAILLCGLLLFLGNTFAQEEFSVTITITDSLTGQPANIAKGFFIQNGKSGAVNFEANETGKYSLTLVKGEYAAEFLRMDGMRHNFRFVVDGDKEIKITF